MFCDVRVCYRLMDVAVKAMRTTSQLILLESLNVLKRFGIMTDTQSTDVVTFEFEGTRVHSFVSGYTDYQMDYF